MLQLGLWIACCGAAAVVLRRRPFVLVAAVLALMFLVPTVGSPLLTGQDSGSLSLHAGTWLVFFSVLVQFFSNSRALAAAISRHVLLFLVLAVVSAAGFLATREGGGGGLVLLIDQVVAPVALFLLIVSIGPSDPALAAKLRVTLLTLASAVTVIAIIQWSTNSAIFYQQGFETQYWFTEKQSRWMGTLDQPLALSFALCAAGALTMGIHRLRIQLPLLVLFAVGILTTQSRVGILIFLAVALLVVLKSKAKFLAKAVIVCILAGAAYLFYDSPLVEGVLGRFADDTGSSQAREAATKFFIEAWPQYILTGGGMTSSYKIGESAGLGTSLESSILMYSIDLGILFALLYFGSMTFIVVRGLLNGVGGGLVLAGVIAVVIPQTYSSLATRSVAGILVWTLMALVTVAADTGRERISSISSNERKVAAVK